MLKSLNKGDSAKITTLGKYTSARKDKKVTITKKNRKTIVVGDQKFCIETGAEVSPKYPISPIIDILSPWTESDERKLQQTQLKARFDKALANLQAFDGTLTEQCVTDIERLSKDLEKCGK